MEGTRRERPWLQRAATRPSPRCHVPLGVVIRQSEASVDCRHSNLLLSFSVTSRLPLSLRLALTGLFLISIEVSAYQVAWYFSHGPVVSDLRIFMTGVEIVRTGEGHELYDFDEHRRVQTRLYPETKRAGVLAFNHLAYELLLYWPVAHLPYRHAR